VPFITDLDGDEARTIGEVLASTTSALREATGSEHVYLYVFGEGIPHLHLHLAPHRLGDALSHDMIRGPVTEQQLPSGAFVVSNPEFPPLPEAELRQTAERVRALLG
jgi:diadenosine tetraphosphate (Ap4A) HIT family hydrolase